MSNRKNWQLGVSCSIRTKIYGICDEAFKAFADDAVKNIEISLDIWHFEEYDFVKNAEHFKSLTDKYGVNIWSLHIPFSQVYHPALTDEAEASAFVEKCLQQIQAGIRIGIKTFVIHPSSEPNEAEEREARMQASIRNLTVLSKYCHENGAVLAVENLPRTCLGNCASEMIRFLKEVPYIQACFDTNHSLIQSNTEFLDELIANGMQGRIRTVHVSDYDFVNERHWMPKQGIVDWDALLDRLEKLEYDGVFIYELSKPTDMKFFYTLQELKENYESLIK